MKGSLKMYEVQVVSRGSEGVRSFKAFRISKKGSEELQKRMEKKDISMVDLLTGIELESEAESKKSKS